MYHIFFFFKQKTAYEMRISDWSSDVCSSDLANEDDEKIASAAESARVLVDAVRRGVRPRDIITRASIENAVSVIMATGGSTNAVLHFLAIAHAPEVEWTIDDFERIRRPVPVICDLKPSRSEERRVGKECVRTWRSRGSTSHK